MVIQIKPEKYRSLSDSEKAVIDFINQNEQQITNMSITSIANKTFTSAATVSRTIQKCGYSGISELRYSIMKQDENSDKYPILVNEILAKSYRECVNTIENIHVTSILKVIDYLKEARKVFIVARGFTTLIADEFHMQLSLLGYNVHIIKDATWMDKVDKLVSNEDLVIILTVRNTTMELYEVAKLAKSAGSKIVTCICVHGSNLESLSDIVIYGHSEEIANNGAISVSSRLALTVITRTIIEYLSL